jgi:hypothetical protein
VRLTNAHPNFNLLHAQAPSGCGRSDDHGRYVQEATFRIQILEQRAKRHDEISQQKFRAMVHAGLFALRCVAGSRVFVCSYPCCLQLEKLHSDARLSALHEPMSRATDR